MNWISSFSSRLHLHCDQRVSCSWFQYKFPERKCPAQVTSPFKFPEWVSSLTSSPWFLTSFRNGFRLRLCLHGSHLVSSMVSVFMVPSWLPVWFSSLLSREKECNKWLFKEYVILTVYLTMCVLVQCSFQNVLSKMNSVKAFKNQSVSSKVPSSAVASCLYSDAMWESPSSLFCALASFPQKTPKSRTVPVQVKIDQQPTSSHPTSLFTRQRRISLHM